MKTYSKSVILFSFLFLFHTPGLTQNSNSRKVVVSTQAETITLNQKITKIVLASETIEMLGSLENSNYVITFSPIGTNAALGVKLKAKNYFEIEQLNFNGENPQNVVIDYVVFVNGEKLNAPTNFATSIYDK